MASKMPAGLKAGNVVQVHDLTSEEREQGLQEGMYLTVLQVGPFTVYRPGDTERALVLSPVTGRTLWLWPDQVTPVLPGQEPDAVAWNVLRGAQELADA